MIAFLLAATVLAAADVPPNGAAPVATPAPAAAAAADAKPKPKDSDVVCWNERPTGSHMIQRICATRAELDQVQRQNQKDLASHGNAPRAGGIGAGRAN